MENITGRETEALEVRPVRGESPEKDGRSCLDCDHLIARRGFPHCVIFDKTTSLEVNWCSGYTPR
jgi:hypothetical protein